MSNQDKSQFCQAMHILLKGREDFRDNVELVRACSLFVNTPDANEVFSYCFNERNTFAIARITQAFVRIAPTSSTKHLFTILAALYGKDEVELGNLAEIPIIRRAFELGDKKLPLVLGTLIGVLRSLSDELFRRDEDREELRDQVPALLADFVLGNHRNDSEDKRSVTLGRAFNERTRKQIHGQLSDAIQHASFLYDLRRRVFVREHFCRELAFLGDEDSYIGGESEVVYSKITHVFLSNATLAEKHKTLEVLLAPEKE